MFKIPKRKEIFSRQSICQNTDSYILIVFGSLFSALGFFGILGPQIIGSVTLALLAALSFSQIRSRFQVENVANTWHRSRTEILETNFPSAYMQAQKTVSKNYFYTGETMMRTITHMRTEFPRIFANGGSVRILLPDPNNDQLMEAIAQSRSDKEAASLKRDIENSFRVAKETSNEGGDIELRITDAIPKMGINGLDVGEPSGKIMVQMYGYKSSSPERGPIFLLEASDGEWFERFSQQIERLWEDGKTYSDDET